MSRKKSKRAYKKASSSSLDPALHRYIQEFHKYFDNQCYAQALAIADRLADSFPDLPEAWELKANALGHLDRMREAANSMSIAYTLLSDESPATLLKFAQYQLLAGFTEEALKNLKTLAKLDPNNEKVFAWTSRAYHALGKNEEAIAVNDKAFKIAPLDPETLLWRSRIMDQAKRPTEARKAALQLKEISPERIGVSNHIASLDLREGLYESAEYHFDQELLLEDNANVSINKLVAMHYNPSYTADNIYQATCSWQEKYVDRSLVNRAKTVRRASKRVRLGLLSGSFRVHPVGQMILPVLQYIDNLEVELFAYNTSHASDIITKEIKECIANWANVGGLNDEELEKKIRQDKIDILIDLNGGGEGSRYLMLSREPAPLIVKWVGMLINTTGLECFDYLLSDSIETPSNVGALYTEKLIRLPDDYICYKIPEYIPDINSLPALKNGYVTFGCLNNPAKLSPPLIKEWSKLLEELPGSKLLLRGIQFEGEDFCQRMIARFSEHGINSDRLLLQGPAKHQEFLGTYRHIDIALDTWPYSGGLTTCEALAMGVPVVTCVGPTFAGRHSATHLANAGLPELVTDNWDDFRKRAKELAADLPSLAVIRAALRTILKESPVCDGERFAQHFTKAMRGIWQRYCEGKAPEALTFNKEGDAWFADEDQPIELVEVEAEPETQEAEFEWKLESPITVIDNGALFARHPRFNEWMQTGNFAVITFDPGSLLTKQADELKQLGEWHHYPHATLGDGKDATLYATLDPELTGTLQPLEEQQTGEQDDPLRVLSTLPISTVALDSIEGLPSVDVLVLDDLNEAVSILNNGAESLKNALIIKVSVSFQLSHERQPRFSKIENLIEEIGFRFYSFFDLSYSNTSSDEVASRGCLGAELVKATAVFVPNAKRLKGMSYEKKSKLSLCLDEFLGVNEVAFDMLHDPRGSGASYFVSNEVIPKYDDKLKADGSFLVNIPNISALPADVREVELKSFLGKFNKELESGINSKDYFELACGLLDEDDSNLIAFYVLINCLRLGVGGYYKSLPSWLLARLECIGWKDKVNVFAFWLKKVIETNKDSVADPIVSVIVVTRDINDKVIENVRELSRQTVGGEIIVLTADVTKVDKIYFYADKVIELKGNAGASHARNIGAALSSAPVLLFVDDDGFPQDNFVLSHIEAHEYYDVHSVRGMCSQPSMLPSPPHYNLGNKVIPYPVNLEGNASYRAEVFYEVGGWDDSIMYGHEGIELSHRLLKKYSAPEKQIYHPGPLLHHEYIKNESQGKEKAYKQHVSHLLIMERAPFYNKSVSDKFGSIGVVEIKKVKCSHSVKLAFNRG